MYFEVIKVTGEMSLATFAYLQCNNHQLDVFCTYIQYCFTKIDKKTPRPKIGVFLYKNSREKQNRNHKQNRKNREVINRKFREKAGFFCSLGA